MFNNHRQVSVITSVTYTTSPTVTERRSTAPQVSLDPGTSGGKLAKPGVIYTGYVQRARETLDLDEVCLEIVHVAPPPFGGANYLLAKFTPGEGVPGIRNIVNKYDKTDLDPREMEPLNLVDCWVSVTFGDGSFREGVTADLQVVDMQMLDPAEDSERWNGVKIWHDKSRTTSTVD